MVTLSSKQDTGKLKATEETALLSDSTVSRTSQATDDSENSLQDFESQQQQQQQPAHKISYYLYFSHFLSTWNARVLEYGAVLFLAEMVPNTFLPLSLYAFFRSLTAIIFSHKLGLYIDHTNRLEVVRTSIVHQRIAVVTTCFLLWLMALLLKPQRGDSNAEMIAMTFESSLELNPLVYSAKFNILMALLIICACVERLCATMNLVSVERDWVVVIAGNDSRFLQILNARMRRIDLFCKLLGPLAISYLDAWLPLVGLIWILLLWNFGSMFIEYFTIEKVYQAFDELQEDKPALQPTTDLPNPATTQGSRVGILSKLISWLYLNFVSPFTFYFDHKMVLVSFSLSILYLTVLSFGPQMVSFLLFQGRSPIEVGLLRTVSVICELSTTFLSPWVMGFTGPLYSGAIFILWQVTCLVAGLSLAWPQLGTDPRGALYLVVGVILSRIGLWGFDLSAQVLIQNGVEAENRARFSSAEAACQSFFELVSFAQTMKWSTPQEFKYPAIVSMISVIIAALVYFVYVLKKTVL
ncbi:uncharacterized protein SAPINGB_P001428 [Magnusiomyces paraingens]|uniref:Solute carrier family 40 member n=1 Tax=Magnusiomyces paraingens TaxID=2606893 RepID=A0A5E8B673_9ASCO|nr:uncharacterized protein SAPINGB_P001428 [Saprochaete ingens]VVT46869.1 unnamed protein product [Saprochaete ingens]